MARKQMVTTGLSFIDGRLVPAGTPVFIDTDQIDLDNKVYGEDDKPLKGKTKDVGLVDHDGAQASVVPVVMAAIGPSGPNPTAPQQIAAGDMQVGDGYATPEGTPIVAEGSAEALEVEEGGEPATGRKSTKKTSNPLS